MLPAVPSGSQPLLRALKTSWTGFVGTRGGPSADHARFWGVRGSESTPALSRCARNGCFSLLTRSPPHPLACVPLLILTRGSVPRLGCSQTPSVASASPGSPGEPGEAAGRVWEQLRRERGRLSVPASIWFLSGPAVTAAHIAFAAGAQAPSAAPPRPLGHLGGGEGTSREGTGGSAAPVWVGMSSGTPRAGLGVMGCGLKGEQPCQHWGWGSRAAPDKALGL